MKLSLPSAALDKMPQISSKPASNIEVPAKIGHRKIERRTANYKPNIWKYDLLQKLRCTYADKRYGYKAQILKEDMTCVFVEAMDPLAKLELVDSITKQGLAKEFEREIRETLDSIVSSEPIKGESLYVAALYFRVLRQHGYNVSQDMFLGFMDTEGAKFMPSKEAKADTLLELLEASHLASDRETTMAEARLFCMERLKDFQTNSDQKLHRRIAQALNLPLHWRVGWYNIKKQIHAHERENKIVNQKLVKLAKLNFNITQAAHLEELKETVRWWMNLGITEKLSFSRDRIVESFVYAVGVASEPQDSSLRRWLSKFTKFILVIDDIYDVYGSLDELECFTNAVDRWSPEEVEGLPECMKTCFLALMSTTDEIGIEIQKEKCWTSAAPHLQKAWADFCKSLLLEAEWYYNGHTPSLQEYLDNGWISSSGPLLSLLIIFAKANLRIKDISEILEDTKDIIYYSSLIIRLCNDQGTTAAELERGDAPSSILCYMREASVTEEAATEHVRSIILGTWRKINTAAYSSTAADANSFLNYIINAARTAHFIYQSGDGFGNQDEENQKRILSNLLEPLPLN